MSGELLRVRDLQVSFGTDAGPAQVLDRVNLDVEPGEIVGLVGESGCGKTTLARAILNVLPANSARIGEGRIEFTGESLLDMNSATLASRIRGRAITFVPQDPFGSFNPVFPIGAQIMELMKWKSPARGGGTSHLVDHGLRGFLQRHPRLRRRQDRARIVDLMKLVQLPQPEEILAKYPHQVSGGQRQRLMIAMALLPEPRLIIADEPTTALDVTIQAQILKLLRNLAAERGVALIFTTHDLGTAYEICDRVVVMYAGQEMESAPSDGFFERPSHPYTRRLLESLPSREHGIAGIRGEIPALIDPPSGCRFHPRCDHATDLCRQSRPQPRELAPGHEVRCHHPVTAPSKRVA
ncbi:MAG: ABC transporter ATP-binding protein [Gammaproteobacteria bacterium]